MKLHLFGRTFAALMAGLSWGYRWASSSTAAGTWIRPVVSRRDKPHVRSSRNRHRQTHGRA